MSHPSIEELLAGTPEAMAHAAACASCRQLAALRAPVGSASDAPSTDGVEEAGGEGVSAPGARDDE